MKSIWSNLLFCLLLFLPAALIAENISLLGSLEFWDTASDVVGDDEIIAVRTGDTGIKILDISDIDNIRETASIQNLSYVRDILYVDEHLFVCTRSNVYIYDLTVHNNPVLIDTIQLQTYAYTFTIADTLLIAGGQYLTIYDISDLNNITLLSYTLMDSPISCIICIENYLYGIADNLITYNISDTANPIQIDHENIDIDGEDVVYSGTHLYFWDAYEGYDTEYEEIPPFTSCDVINIENRENPHFVSRFYLDFESADVKTHDGNMYVVNSSESLNIYSFQTPSQPQIISSSPLGRSLVDLHFSDNTAYVSDQYFGLRVVDISTPLGPELIGNHQKIGVVKNIVISGDYAYTTGSDYFTIIDISDKTNPEIAWSYYNNHDTNRGVYNPVISGNYVYISTACSIKVFEISDPYNPVEVGSCEQEFDFGYLYKYDHYLISSYYSGDSGCKVIDINNPTNPAVVSGFLSDSDIFSWDIITDFEVFNNNLAAMVVGDHTFAIVGMNNPAYSSIITSMDRFDRYVEISDQKAYLAHGQSVLDIFDLSSPSNPIWIASHPLNSYIYKLDVTGAVGITIDDSGYFRVLDLNDSQNIIQVGEITLPNRAEDIVLIDSTAYTGHELNFYVLDCSDAIGHIENAFYNPNPSPGTLPDELRINRVYPNPMNPTNPISFVEIDLPKSGHLQVDIYNTLGRKVRTIADDKFPGGKHYIPLDGSKLTSGTYFIKASLAGKTCKAKKITLVK